MDFMIIGVDIDEVLADFIPELLDYHNELYGTNLTKDKIHSYNLCNFFGGTREEVLKKVYDFYETHSFKNLSIVSGSQEGIQALSENNKLVIITSRPPITQEITTVWLQKHFLNKFFSIHFTDELVKKEGNKIKKSDICIDLGVDIMIEDSLKNALECASIGIKVLLLDCPWNQSEDLAEGITRVKSWEEIKEKIKNQNL